jgi:NADH:ubiquinone reductase (non-electrogenic)
VVVGGGPTGIEFAAELHDFLNDAAKWYPGEVSDVRITLLEATDEILPSFDQRLQTYALKRFDREGIEVRTHSPAKQVDANRVTLESGEELHCGLIVWSTGIAPRPLIQDANLTKSDKGMLLTNDHCQAVDHPDVFALGDTAQHQDRALPATAQVAQREGKYLADRFNREAKGKELKPFQFKSQGMLAYVGGRRAIAELPGADVTGRKAWVFWRSVYLTKLVSVKNKLLVAVDWFVTALFGRDISRF